MFYDISINNFKKILNGFILSQLHVQSKPLNVIAVHPFIVIILLKGIGYCYLSVNVITFDLALSENIERLLVCNVR